MIFRTLPMRKKRGITSSDYVMWHRQGILMRKKTGHARCFGIIVIPFIKTFIKNLCPVDFSPQTHSMNVFPHEKKVDIGVLPRAEASSRFRHHAQTYRFPNRSLVRKTRQGDIAAVFWTVSLRQKSTIPLLFTLKTGVHDHWDKNKSPPVFWLWSLRRTLPRYFGQSHWDSHKNCQLFARASHPVAAFGQSQWDRPMIKYYFLFFA